MLTRRRSAGFLAAVAILVSACGPSEQAQFDAAFEDGEAALLVDDLTGAQQRFEDALRLRPRDAAALAALALVADITASRDRYEEAISLLDRGRHLLEARSLFLEVSESDLVRYDEAQRSARVAEQRWIEESMELLDRRLAGDDFSAVTLSISEFRRQLPRSELLESAIADSSDALIASAVRIATIKIETGDLPAAQRVLSDASNALRLEETPEAFNAVRQAIDQQREIIAQARQAELAEQRAQRERELAPRAVSVPVVESARLVSSGPYGVGDEVVVELEWSADSAEQLAIVSLLYFDEIGRAYEPATSGVVRDRAVRLSFTVDDQAVGMAQLHLISLTDTRGNASIYRRTGVVDRTPPGAEGPSSHSLNLSELDVQFVVN